MHGICRVAGYTIYNISYEISEWYYEFFLSISMLFRNEVFNLIVLYLGKFYIMT